MPEANPQDEIPKARPQSRLWQWFDRRTGLNELLHKSLDEPIPGGARFAYVFGSGLLFIFLSQIITGICLALYYVPSAENAHVSVAYMVKEVSAGAFLRSMHSYGSSAMIVVLILHFLQTFVYGSYKGKRELLWISGCVLSLLILGMAFTGYLLPWDQKAYFATSVGTNIAGQVPFIGETIRRLLRGGPTMGTLTISRFYVLHVFVIPAAIFLFVAGHVFMFRRAGAAGPISEDPAVPRMRSEKFYPKQVVMDMAFALLLIAALGVLAHFRPVEVGPVANPNDSHYLPRPEWYYLPMFQWLKYWEGPRTIIGIIVIPTVLLVLFFLLPFLDRGPERRPWRRPIPVGAVLIVLLGALWLGIISHVHDAHDPSIAAQLAQQQKDEDQFFHAPFEPYLASSHSANVAPATLNTLAAQGKTIFDSHGCSGCHGEGGMGGAVAPALTQVGQKLPETALINLLRNPTAKMRAGGMTPLNLDVTGMTALSSYLRALSTTEPVVAVARSEAAAASSPFSEQEPTAPAVSEIAAKSSVEAAKAADVWAGKEMFRNRACFACHGESGAGTQRAPSLIGIGAKFSAAQLTKVLRNPTARMQAGGMGAVTASDQDLNYLVTYLRNLKPTGAAKLAQSEPPRPTPTATSGVQGTVTSGPPTAETRPLSQLPATKPGSSTEALNPQIKQGRAIFDVRGCAACHGIAGTGTQIAPALASAGQRMQPPELASLLQHPNQRMRDGGMPPVNINEQSMSALVAYVRNLGTPPPASSVRGEVVSGTSASAVVPPVQPPMNNLELRGKSVFEAHRCGSCHGPAGVGGTAAAPALAGTGGSLPPELLAQMLRHHTERMQQGGMPPVSVTDRELKALVAYIGYISRSSIKH